MVFYAEAAHRDFEATLEAYERVFGEPIEDFIARYESEVPWCGASGGYVVAMECSTDDVAPYREDDPFRRGGKFAFRREIGCENPDVFNFGDYMGVTIAVDIPELPVGSRLHRLSAVSEDTVFQLFSCGGCESPFEYDSSKDGIVPYRVAAGSVLGRIFQPMDKPAEAVVEISECAQENIC